MLFWFKYFLDSLPPPGSLAGLLPGLDLLPPPRLLLLGDEAAAAGDGEGQSHELPVRLLLLLVGVVRDLQAGRVVRPWKQEIIPELRRARQVVFNNS